ncbi:MAG: DUF2252 family protein [Myxococcota bacterium]|nr:DUF2252 family protein [Myxococcota bacterium]
MFYAIFFISCQTSTDRSAWLKEQLYIDNRIWLQRDSQLLADKFREMGTNSYNFMRGTVPLYYAELTRLNQNKPSTAFLTQPESTAIPLFGDPHPENASVLMQSDGNFDVEFVDLDSATYGPWLFDLRRSATALRLLGRQFEGCDDRCEEALVVGLVEGLSLAYARESYPFEESTIWKDYIEEAIEEGLERKKFYKVTEESASSERKIIRSESLDTNGEGILDVTTSERNQAERLGESFADAHGLVSFRILDVVRKFGTGVSSRPAIRYVILWDQGDSTENDDVLTQFREILDPPNMDAVAYASTAVFHDNADRINVCEDKLWINSEADPYHHGFWDDGHGFKSMSWNSSLQDIELHKMTEQWDEGDYALEDIVDFASSLGWMIGHVHHRNTGIDGQATHKIVQADLISGGGWSKLETELKNHSGNDADFTERDYELFKQMLEQDGMLLGFEHIEGVP